MYLIRISPLIFLAFLAVSGCGYFLQPDVKQGMINLEQGSYQLDPRHTTVLFKINHMGLSTFIGRFNQVEASLDYDPKNPAAAKLSAIIYTASIDVNNPDFAETLTGSGWLDSKRFPQALFVTESVELVDGNKARFKGDLTLRGIAVPVILDIHFNGGADNLLTGRYTLGFSAHSRFKRSQFGIDQFIPAIGDDVEIEVHAEFQRR